MATINCFRCRKSTDGADVVVMQTFSPAWKINPTTGTMTARADGFDGELWIAHKTYHRKCLPPILFHKFAGSRPAAQSPATTSLRNEHGVAGGLKRKGRKRPSRRKRYRATALRLRQKTAAHAEAQESRTMAMKIQETLERGGKPSLCHCPTFTDRSKDSWCMTPNGYCRYCGGWDFEVFRSAVGDERLQAEIDELASHYRVKMRAVIAATFAATTSQPTEQP